MAPDAASDMCKSGMDKQLPQKLLTSQNLIPTDVTAMIMSREAEFSL